MSDPNRYRWVAWVAASLLLVPLSADGVEPADGVEATSGAPLSGTKQLRHERPLDEIMVEGIDRFVSRKLASSRQQRLSRWDCDFTSPEAYESSLAPHRKRFGERIGSVDPRVQATGIEYLASTTRPSLVAENDQYTVHAVRWAVLDGVTAEGLFLQPKKDPIARVVAIPDADWTPEMIVGIESCPTQFAGDFAALGCEVLVPMLINRDNKYSANERIGRRTNLTHREFIYRQTFELGRHIIGLEVQKILAAVDQFELRNRHEKELPTVVAGVSEGGLLAMYAAALDNRIDAAIVSGYFDQRESVWSEPVYRNVWSLLSEFGDAEIAGMIAPRLLYVEDCPAIEELDGPPPASRNIAAPGVIDTPQRDSVRVEWERALVHWNKMRGWKSTAVASPVLAPHISIGDTPIPTATVHDVIGRVCGDDRVSGRSLERLPVKLERLPVKKGQADESFADESVADDRQQRQVDEMVRYAQRLLQVCHRAREQRINAIDRSSVESWVESSESYRQFVYANVIGKLPSPTIDPNPRSRQILASPDFTGYEVVLDVYPDVIAGGILLLPNDLKPGERRPVVVCQHGLEGTPMDTIGGSETKGYRAYKAFSAELARRGFIVYAPQNPYRGRDRFRVLQRKSNPLGLSLFSYITPQHLVTLRWLSTLAGVDPDRIGFYGLSYGGKTAVRVPPMLPPTASEPGYCLSICSADFNEWVAKNVSVDAPFSYLWTGEYEIFEWNMGHVANYAELSMLMTPRPFMVERGHNDGVGIDPWVAWEYAKVRQHYNQLGIGDRTEIEFFDGPHTIHGQGTFDFLHRHLDWPAPAEPKTTGSAD